MKTVWSWWRGTGTLFEVHQFFCYMAYNTKKNNTNYTVLLFCNQWGKKTCKKGRFQRYSPRRLKWDFFLFIILLINFTFWKIQSQNLRTYVKVIDFGESSLSDRKKSSLWPALWVIFTPAMSIMLTMVFTLSYHLLTSLVLLQPKYSPLAGLTFLISWMVDTSQSIVGENPSLWPVIHLCARISVLSEFDCLFFSQHPTTVQRFTSYYSDSTSWLRARDFPFCSCCFSELLMFNDHLFAPSSFFHRIHEASIQRDCVSTNS